MCKTHLTAGKNFCNIIIFMKGVIKAVNLGDKINNDVVYDMYVNKKMSSTQIAKEFGCSHRTILLKLRKIGVERRNLSESQFVYCGSDFPNELLSYDYLHEMYEVRGMTRDAIGEELGVSPGCVKRYLIKCGIHVRGNSEASTGNRVGEKHPNWKGGITPLLLLVREYFSIHISPKIRERDNYTCQMCGKHSNLHVHHKVHLSKIIQDIIAENEDKTHEELYNVIINDERFLDEDNLITLCKDCHLFGVHGYKKSISNEAQ